MGSSSPFIISNYKNNQITLCDWIGKVRVKKREIRRRKSPTDLRIAAMLTTALQRAEAEMRRKQQERAMKWAELNLQIRQIPIPKNIDDEEEIQRKKEIDELWHTELNGLDNFINSLNQIKTNVVR